MEENFQEQKPKGKAGRKPGAINKKTAEIRALIKEPVAKKLVKNMIKLANGDLHYEKTLKSGVEIWKTIPDREANMYLLDQKYGKAKQSTEITGKDGTDIFANVRVVNLTSEYLDTKKSAEPTEENPID